MLKRGLDLIASTVLLIALSPAMLIIAACVRLFMGPPVLFRHQRPGFRGAPFTFVKFRSMRAGIGTDAERLTRLGSFLRRTSIDELPQLWNVFKGEMSLVGPRPLMMEYLPRYSSEQARRHDVKPGMTGWAQVNGRNAISWEEKFKLDVWYVDHYSFWLDLKILFLTAWKVFTRQGISAPGDATMPEFTGSPRDPK